MSVTVRRALPEDAKAIHALECEVFSDPWSERSVTEHLASPISHSFVASDEGGVIGYCLLTSLLSEGELLRIATHPCHRRMGIARTLLEGALSDGTLDVVYLEVRATNAPAIALYRALGFEAYGTRKNYYKNPTDDAILMSRRGCHI